MSTVTFMPPIAIVPPAPKESLRSWSKSFEVAAAVFSEKQAIALLPAYCNRNEAEREAAKQIAEKFVDGKLREALDELVVIIDGPTKPHEDAAKFFKYEMANHETLFEAMFALKTLAGKANISSTEVIAQKFLAIIPYDLKTAILKDPKGKDYAKLKLDDLLALARHEQSVRAPTEIPHSVKVAKAECIATSLESTTTPKWFEVAMGDVVNRLERLESAKVNSETDQRGATKGNQNGRPVNKFKCRNCRSTDHLIRKCPQRFCQACGKRGHDAWMDECPNKHL